MDNIYIDLERIGNRIPVFLFVFFSKGVEYENVRIFRTLLKKRKKPNSNKFRFPPKL